MSGNTNSSGHPNRRRGPWATFAIAALPVWLLFACELTEVVLTEPADIVVVEMYLRAGDDQQFAFLHRTRAGTDDAGFGVPGAQIRVSGPAGQYFELHEAGLSGCLETQYLPPPEHVMLPAASLTEPEPVPPGTCYASEPGIRIDPATTYMLSVDLPDGGKVFGQTRVPGPFRLLGPDTRGPECALQPLTKLELTWTPAEDAWIYQLEAEFSGLRAALPDWETELESDTLRLLGLAVSRHDTTVVFPTDFGLFDRFGTNTELLLALRDGLPAGIVADLTVSATDRNLTNWLRGGQFNPSGPVRVPSVAGDGTGVFGSMLPLSKRLRVGATDIPACY